MTSVFDLRTLNASTKEIGEILQESLSTESGK